MKIQSKCNTIDDSERAENSDGPKSQKFYPTPPGRKVMLSNVNHASANNLIEKQPNSMISTI